MCKRKKLRITILEIGCQPKRWVSKNILNYDTDLYVLVYPIFFEEIIYFIKLFLQQQLLKKGMMVK